MKHQKITAILLAIAACLLAFGCSETPRGRDESRIRAAVAGALTDGSSNEELKRIFATFSDGDSMCWAIDVAQNELARQLGLQALAGTLSQERVAQVRSILSTLRFAFGCADPFAQDAGTDAREVQRDTGSYDAGTRSDAGSYNSDAGSYNSDAGSYNSDAGTRSDAGSYNSDAGSSNSDAGSSNYDGGLSGTEISIISMDLMPGQHGFFDENGSYSGRPTANSVLAANNIAVARWRGTAVSNDIAAVASCGSDTMASPDLVVQFDLTRPRHVRFDTNMVDGMQEDTVLTLYTSGQFSGPDIPRALGSEAACNDDYQSGTASYIDAYLPAGQNTVRVGGFAGREVNVTLTARILPQ